MTLDDYKSALHAQPTTLVLVGPSGAGKSTVAERLSTAPDQVVSSDRLREIVCGDATDMAVSGIAHQIKRTIVGYRSSHGMTSIVDGTALHASERRRIDEITSPSSRLWCLIVEAPLDVCLDRQGQRERTVPADVVQKQHRRLGDLEFQPDRFGRVDVWQSVDGQLVGVA